MKGILFDLGHIGGGARENLRAAGLADRCRAMEGSFFESIPAGADAYLFRHIIHDWTDEQCLQILENCRRGNARKPNFVRCSGQPVSNSGPSRRREQ